MKEIFSHISRAAGFAGRRAFIWLLFSGVFHSACGGNYLSGGIRELVTMNFSGQAAESFERIGAMLASEPENYRAYFMRALCYDWFIAPNEENRRYDSALHESLKACIEYAGKVDSDDLRYDRALFFRSMAAVMGARLKSIRGHPIESRWATREGKDSAEELTGEFPEDLDAQLPLAFFNYFWGGSSVWKRMAQFTMLMPRGQRKDGLRKLEEIAANGDDSKLWARRFLLGIYSRNPAFSRQALEMAESLHRMFPDNAIFQLALADCYRKSGRWVLAEAVYRSIDTKVSSHLPSYDEVAFEISRLRTVECRINLGKMDEAFGNVRDILVSNPINPEWVVPRAHLCAARIYRHRGQLRRAQRALKYALDGVDYENLHDVAKKELEAVEKMTKGKKP